MAPKKDGADFNQRRRVKYFRCLLQDSRVEFLPVVQVVQVHRAGIHRAVIRQAIGAQDALARGVVMDVAHDGLVVLVERGLVQFHTGV